MKALLPALLFPLLAQAAEVPVSRLVQEITKTPAAQLSVDTYGAKLPANFTLWRDHENLSAKADPARFLLDLRSRLPSRRIPVHGWNQFELVAEYGKLYRSDLKGQPVYDLLTDIGELQPEPSANGPHDSGYLTRDYRLLSVVGTIVSYSTKGGDHYPGANESEGFDTIETVDVARREETIGGWKFSGASLTDAVDPAEILRALKADPYLKSLSGGDQPDGMQSATTLADFASAANEALGADCYHASFGEKNLVPSFAYQDYDAASGLVTVLVPLTGRGTRSCGGNPKILLPLQVKPSDDLRELLEFAVRDHHGLLGKDAN